MHPFDDRGEARVRWLILAVVAALLGAMLLPGTAAAKPKKNKDHKVDVCHLKDDGTYKVLNISKNAVPAHVAHGDLVVGEDVDENCEPLEALLAVAYSNLDGSPGFSPDSGDVLIAKLVDIDDDGGVSDGDTLITNQYPLNFTPVFPAGFGSFDATSHVVTSAGLSTSTEVSGNIGGDFFAFREYSVADVYTEGSPFGGSVNLADAFGSALGSDIISAASGGLSMPDTVVPFTLRLAGADDAFIDVDIFV